MELNVLHVGGLLVYLLEGPPHETKTNTFAGKCERNRKQPTAASRVAAHGKRVESEKDEMFRIQVGVVSLTILHSCM